MRKWLWIAAVVLLLAAAAGVWWAVQNPVFWTGIGTAIGGMVWNWLAPHILKRKSPEDEAIDHQHAREGTQRETRQQPHPGEGGRH